MSVSNANGQLADFLGAAPAIDDVVTFSITFDPATLGAQSPTGFPNTVAYPGGIPLVRREPAVRRLRLACSTG